MSKIAIILPADLPVPSVLGGAIESLVDNFIKENEKSGYFNIVVFSYFNKLAYIESQGYKKTKFIWLKQNIFIKLLKFIFKFFRKLGMTSVTFDTFRLYYLIKFKKIDKIVVEGNPSNVKFLKKNFGKNVELIFHLHTKLNFDKYKYFENAILHADKIIVVSNYLKKYIESNVSVSNEKIFVLYNCINEIFFSNIDNKYPNLIRRENLGISQDDLVVVFTGRLVPEKGLLELIEACKILDSKIKIKLLIIGSFGSGFAKINKRDNIFKNKIEKEIIGYENKFIFCGYISNNDLVKYYGICDILVFPSITDEAAGLVAIEGIACGLPVIASDAGGIPEYINKKCGIIINRGPNISINIAKAIMEINSNKELQKKLKINSKISAQKFKPRQYFLKFKEIIEK